MNGFGKTVHSSEDRGVVVGRVCPVMKSSAMCDQGRCGTGSGCSRPCGDW